MKSQLLRARFFASLRMTAVIVGLLATACCLVPTAAFGQGTAGPSAANSANYNAFSAHFGQPSVSWAATGMTLTYTAGSIANYSSTAMQTITAGTMTLASATEYIYWSSGGSLSHTGTQGTALAASPLYTCTTSAGNITGCIAMSSALPTTGTVTVNGAATFSGFCSGTVGSNATNYVFGLGGAAIACSSNTSAVSAAVMPTSGTLENFVVYAGTAPGGSLTDVLTVNKNGAATSITCSLVHTTATCSDTSHTASVAAGDLITVSDATATSGAAANLSVSFEKH